MTDHGPAPTPDDRSGSTEPAIGQLSYEDARAELTEIVRKLESGGSSLEDSLALWERGELLADVCQRWLEGATSRLDEAISAHEAPAASSEPESH